MPGRPAGTAAEGGRGAEPVLYHRPVTYARDERLALCDLLDQKGPGAPTLCAGWRTLDLAAHLVLREHRPDAGLGILGGPLAERNRRVQRRLAERTPFARLVETIRNGPPRLSFYGIPGVDERTNTIEFFVHHEDVRRAKPGWEPRDISQGLSEVLWRRLRFASWIFRRSPVGIELARDDDSGSGAASGQVRITAKARAPVVTVTGPPAELTMWAFGRAGAARVRVEGTDQAVRTLGAVQWSV
jgi:uncharacterized protein (TIGR03085 family)